MADGSPTNVTLNGVLLVPQPSRLLARPPRAIRMQGINGGYISFTPTKGWEVELIYGSGELADADPITAILEALGSGDGDTHVLEWDDTAGEHHTLAVILDEQIQPGIHWGSITERFSVTFYEAA